MNIEKFNPLCLSLVMVVFLLSGCSSPASPNGSIGPTIPSWQSVGRAGLSPGSAGYPSLALDTGGIPYLAYSDSTRAGAVSVMRFNGSAWEQVGTAGFSPGAAQFTSLTIDKNNNLFVAFQDGNKSLQASVMEWTGTTWNLVGSQGISPSQADYLSLAIDGAGILYIAFTDYQNGRKASVMKFANNVWSSVGTAGISIDDSIYITIAIDSNNIPFVGFADRGNDSSGRHKASVMKFNGTSWIQVGPTLFSDGFAYDLSLTFDRVNVPHISYEDAGNASKYKATVMKFDGTNWFALGGVGFSPSAVQYTSLAFNSVNQPLVAFQGYSNGAYSKASLMKFDGANWQMVGSANFSPGVADYLTLRINGADIPYVSFRDGANNNAATVMKFQ